MFAQLIFQLKIFENDNLNKIVKLGKSFLDNVTLYVQKISNILIYRGEFKIPNLFIYTYIFLKENWFLMNLSTFFKKQ